MSLNAWVFDDLEATHENLPPEDKPLAVINVDNTPEGDPTTTTLNQSEIEQIPNWDVKINLIQEDSTKLVDMMDLRKDIENDETMNRSSAETINATFESFISPTNPLGGFTTLHSKVGFNKTMFFMDRQIKSTMENLQARIGDFVQTEVPEIQKQLEDTKTDDLQATFSSIMEACACMSRNVQMFCNGTVVIPTGGRTFSDLKTDPLCGVDPDAIPLDYPLSKGAREALTEMRQVWNTSAFVRGSLCVMRQALQEDQNTDDLEISYGDEGNLAPMYLPDVIEVFGNTNAPKYYQCLFRYTEGLTDAIKKTVKDVETGSTDPYQQANLIQTSAKTLGHVANETNKAKAALNDLSRFASASACFVDALASIK